MDFKFSHIAPIWYTHFGWDVSLGIHICWKGRIDIHFLFGMLSLGYVPIYERARKKFAASNSFHEAVQRRFMEKIKKTKLPEMRAGVPNHHP